MPFFVWCAQNLEWEELLLQVRRVSRAFLRQISNPLCWPWLRQSPIHGPSSRGVIERLLTLYCGWQTGRMWSRPAGVDMSEWAWDFHSALGTLPLESLLDRLPLLTYFDASGFPSSSSFLSAFGAFVSRCSSRDSHGPLLRHLALPSFVDDDQAQIAHDDDQSGDEDDLASQREARLRDQNKRQQAAAAYQADIAVVVGALRKCQQLESLTLADPCRGDSASHGSLDPILALLPDVMPQLRLLVLYGNRPSLFSPSAFVKCIGRCAHLQSFTVRCTSMDDECVLAVVRGCAPELLRLDLASCRQVTWRSLQHIGTENARNLRYLELSAMINMPLAAWDSFCASVPQLRWLGVACFDGFNDAMLEVPVPTAVRCCSTCSLVSSQA